MANEIKKQIVLQIEDSANKVYHNPSTPLRNITQAALGVWENIIATSTSVATFTPVVTTVGQCWVKNLDATNDIDIGVDQGGTFVAFCTLKPGDEAVFPMKTGKTYRHQASASTPKLHVVVYNA